MGSAREDRPEHAHVLLVDDDPEFSRVVDHWLRRAGFDVAHVTDGTSAVLEAIERIPQCVLLDIHLKEESGFTVFERLRSYSQLRHTPIVIVTGDRDETLGPRAKAVGAYGFVDKRVASPELLHVLERAVRTGERRVYPRR